MTSAVKGTTSEPGRIKGIVYVAVAAVLWSTAGFAIKSVPWHPVAIAGIRSGIAALVLLVYWQLQHQALPPLPSKRKLFGAINYVVLVLLFIGANKLTTSANAILLQFTSPVWVVIFAALFLKEKVYKKDIVTIVVVLLGMGLFFVGELSFGGLLGNVFSILSGVAMAIMVVSLKGVQTGSPLEIVFWGNVFAFSVGIPFYGSLEWSTASFLAIGFLGVFQLGFSYIFFAKGIKHVSALEGILIPVLEPLLNPVWVFIFIGEKPTLYALIGGAIVLSAVLVRSLWPSSVRAEVVNSIEGSPTDSVEIRH